MILNCVYVIYQIMMIPLFINILPMLNLGCGDVLFFEKNERARYPFPEVEVHQKEIYTQSQHTYSFFRQIEIKLR